MTDDAARSATRRMRERRETFRWCGRSAAALSAFWLLLSGHYTPLLLALGLASVVLVCWLCVRAGLASGDGPITALAVRLVPYTVWLGKEVLTSSIVVVRRVWSPRLVLRPGLAATPAAGLSPLAQVILANSITLTPGTLSVHVDDEHVEVHGLDRPDVDQLADGRMPDRVRRLQAR